MLEHEPVEVVPVAEPSQRVAVDLAARDGPEDQPRAVTVLQQRAVDRAENLGRQQRLSAAGGHLNAERGEVFANRALAVEVGTEPQVFPRCTRPETGVSLSALRSEALQIALGLFNDASLIFL